VIDGRFIREKFRLVTARLLAQGSRRLASPIEDRTRGVEIAMVNKREGLFPDQHHVPPGCSRNRPFPMVTDPAAPLLRPQRHVPNSIATVHCRIVVAIARMLPDAHPAHANFDETCDATYDTVRLAGSSRTSPDPSAARASGRHDPSSLRRPYTSS
jgi:hypothetical protein